MAGPWRWGQWFVIGGALFTLLAGPLVLGWIGRVLPMDFWWRYMPY